MDISPTHPPKIPFEKMVNLSQERTNARAKLQMLYTTAFQNEQLFSSALEPYCMVQIQLINNLTTTLDACKKRNVKYHLMRNGMFMLQAYRQIENGERFCRLDIKGEDNGITSKRSAKNHHSLGYTGCSFDDMNVKGKTENHPIDHVSTNDRNNVHLFMEGLAKHAKHVMDSVIFLRLKCASGSLTVTRDIISFVSTDKGLSCSHLTPKMLATTTFVDVQEKTIPQWNTAQLEEFFGDENSAQLITKDKKIGANIHPHLINLRTRILAVKEKGLKKKKKGLKKNRKKKSGKNTLPSWTAEEDALVDSDDGGQSIVPKNNPGIDEKIKSQSTASSRNKNKENCNTEASSTIGHETRILAVKEKGLKKKKKGLKKNRKKKSGKNTLPSWTAEEDALVDSDDGGQSIVPKNNPGIDEKIKSQSTASSRNKNKENCNTEASSTIGHEHLKTIDRILPQESKKFRCLSKKEGCHKLKSVLPDVCALDYPPPVLMECAQYFCTKLRNEPRKLCLRVGYIEYINVEGPSRSSSVENILPCNMMEGSMAVVLVIRGKLSSCSGQGPLVCGQWRQCHSRGSVTGETSAMCTQGKLSLLAFHFFTVDTFNCLDKATFSIIKEGFSRTGIEYRIETSMDAASDHVLRPFYHKDFDQNTTTRDTFFQSVSLFLKCTEDELEDILPLSLFQDSQNIKTSMESFMHHYMRGRNSSESFSLTVIANLHGGMDIVYGDKNKALDTDQDCVLYLHNASQPTIHSYRNDCNIHFVLLKQVDSCIEDPQVFPYKQVRAPTYLNPSTQRETPCDLHMTKGSYLQKTISFSPEKGKSVSLPVLLAMSEDEKAIVSQLNFDTPLRLGSDDKILLISDPDGSISCVRDSTYLNDEIMSLLLAGYVPNIETTSIIFVVLHLIHCI